MPGGGIIGAGTSVLTCGLVVPRGLALPRPGDCMTVCCPDFRLMVEEGGAVSLERGIHLRNLDPTFYNVMTG